MLMILCETCDVYLSQHL